MFKIANRQTLKGLEQIFIEGDDLVVKGLNKINSMNPKNAKYMKTAISKAKTYLKEIGKKDPQLLKKFEKDYFGGKNIDDLCADILKKYNW